MRIDDLTPPDRVQCQAMVPNKTWSFMALGPADVDARGVKRGGSRRVDKFYRCQEKPAVIVTETQSDDGVLGSMSLCPDCFIQLCLQRGGTFEVTEDLRETDNAE
jgi:hypothetical protein